MALTTVAESLEMELSLQVFTTYVCSGRDSTLRMRGEILNRLHHRGSKNPFKYLVHFLVFLSFYVFSYTPTAIARVITKIPDMMGAPIALLFI